MSGEDPNRRARTTDPHIDGDIAQAQRRQRERDGVWGPAGRAGAVEGDDERSRKQPTNRTNSFGMRPLSVGAAAVGVITASIGIIAPPAYADDYPNWNDVQQAKQNVADQQALVDKITGLIDGLQTQADAASTASDKAAEAYLVAKIKLDDATAKAADLQKKSTTAAKTAKTSAMRAGLLASHLAKTGGDSSINLLLSGGDEDASDTLLYQLGTMSQLTEQSSTIYRQALDDKNAASSLADQAASAEKARQDLSDSAATALTKAKDAAAAAQAALAQQQSKQTELVSQLATLKSTSEQQETQYLAGVQAQKQQAALAAAAAAAAAAPPPPQPAASGASGASSGVGGGESAPSGGGSAGAPNGSAVETAISYAYAQRGAPYELGGAGPVYYDCSGLTMMAYAAAGIGIGGHSVGAQYDTAAARGQLVPLGQRQRGDLIFWGSSGDLYHVAIYLGNNQIIAARDYGEPLAVEGLWGSPYPYVARPSA